MDEVEDGGGLMPLIVTYPVLRAIFDRWSEEERAAIEREAAEAVMRVVERHAFPAIIQPLTQEA